MIQIRFHGRGGQGAVVASQLLVEAAFREGKYVQAFPYFGVERRGAPVTAFAKIDEKPIRDRSEVYNPDYVIVMDPSLVTVVNVTEGMGEDGVVIVNTEKSPEELGLKDVKNIATVDATGIAIEHKLGSRTAPIVNSAILGAFSKASGIVNIDSIVSSILEKAPAKREENAAAAKDAYEKVKVIQ
ncbi:MAG: pyruvate ferredoxin oxidoreductase subunit gamma [Methanobacteriota archaeon]|nr:MAG: pyruvate ferredoxin oxidoreductase subunit gamma [Euryarchaeota archaeon]